MSKPVIILSGRQDRLHRLISAHRDGGEPWMRTIFDALFQHLQKALSGPPEHPYITAMKKSFGTVTDPAQAAFITPSGEMLPARGIHDEMVEDAISKRKFNMSDGMPKLQGVLRASGMARVGKDQHGTRVEVHNPITDTQRRLIAQMHTPGTPFYLQSERNFHTVYSHSHPVALRSTAGAMMDDANSDWNSGNELRFKAIVIVKAIYPEHPYITAMKNRWGTTKDPQKAGFVTPSGEMIPHNGGHEYMVNHALPGENLTYALARSGMVRVARSPGLSVVDANSPITEAQKNIFVRMHRSGDTLSIGMSNLNHPMSGSFYKHNRNFLRSGIPSVVDDANMYYHSLENPDSDVVKAVEYYEPIDDKMTRTFPQVASSLAQGNQGIELNKVVVPKEMRGQGIGTQFMQALCDHADHHGDRIVCTPSTDFGASSVPRLKDFYKRFGFVENKGTNKDFKTRHTMYRDAELLLGKAVDPSSMVEKIRRTYGEEPVEFNSHYGTTHAWILPDGSVSGHVGTHPESANKLLAGEEPHSSDSFGYGPRQIMARSGAMRLGYGYQDNEDGKGNYAYVTAMPHLATPAQMNTVGQVAKQARRNFTYELINPEGRMIDDNYGFSGMRAHPAIQEAMKLNKAMDSEPDYSTGQKLADWLIDRNGVNYTDHHRHVGYIAPDGKLARLLPITQSQRGTHNAAARAAMTASNVHHIGETHSGDDYVGTMIHHGNVRYSQNRTGLSVNADCPLTAPQKSAILKMHNVSRNFYGEPFNRRFAAQGKPREFFNALEGSDEDYQVEKAIPGVPPAVDMNDMVRRVRPGRMYMTGNGMKIAHQLLTGESLEHPDNGMFLQPSHVRQLLDQTERHEANPGQFDVAHLPGRIEQGKPHVGVVRRDGEGISHIISTHSTWPEADYAAGDAEQKFPGWMRNLRYNTEHADKTGGGHGVTMVLGDGNKQTPSRIVKIIRHENTHGADLAHDPIDGLMNHPFMQQRLAEHPVYQKAAEYMGSHYRYHPDEIPGEALARTAAGQFDTMGLNHEEAFDLLHHIVKTGKIMHGEKFYGLFDHATPAVRNMARSQMMDKAVDHEADGWTSGMKHNYGERDPSEFNRYGVHFLYPNGRLTDDLHDHGLSSHYNVMSRGVRLPEFLNRTGMMRVRMDGGTLLTSGHSHPTSSQVSSIGKMIQYESPNEFEYDLHNPVNDDHLAGSSYGQFRRDVEKLNKSVGNAINGQPNEFHCVSLAKPYKPSELTHIEDNQEEGRILDAKNLLKRTGADHPPITLIFEDDGSKVILDGHHRALAAEQMRRNIKCVGISREAHQYLKDKGYDGVEISYAMLHRAGEKDAASRTDRQFGGEVRKRGLQASADLSTYKANEVG